MTDDLGQTFVLIPRSPVELVIEDMEIPVLFDLGDEGRPTAITLDASPAWKVSGKRIDSTNSR